MFGIGKLIGGALKMVGLEKFAPFVSVAVNALTGNWVGVAQDVLQLASRFSGGNSFLSKVAKFAPLGAFATGKFDIGSLLKGKMNGLLDNFKNLQSGFNAFKGGDILGGGSKILKAFQEIKDFTDNQRFLTERTSSSHNHFEFGARV
jgi:hypothetical protein